MAKKIKNLKTTIKRLIVILRSVATKDPLHNLKKLFSDFSSFSSHFNKLNSKIKKLIPYSLYFILLLLVLSSLWPRLSFQKAAWQLGESPQNPHYHLALAQEHAQNYQYILAQKELSLANQLNPQFVAESSCLVEKILRQPIEKNKIEKEINQLEAIIQKYPEFLNVYLHLSLLYWQLNNSLQADLYLQKASLISPNYPLIPQIKHLFRQK